MVIYLLSDSSCLIVVSGRDWHKPFFESCHLVGYLHEAGCQLIQSLFLEGITQAILFYLVVAQLAIELYEMAYGQLSLLYQFAQVAESGYKPFVLCGKLHAYDTLNALGRLIALGYEPCRLFD